MQNDYTESFDDLTLAEQAKVLAVYKQQQIKWVPVGDPPLGFVLQDGSPPRFIVRKSVLVYALAEVDVSLQDLGYTNLSDIVAIFEQEKLTLGHEIAWNAAKRRVTILRELKVKKRELVDFIAQLIS